MRPFNNAPILDSYLPSLSVDPPKEADTVPLVYTISGPLEHIFGYSDAQLGREISALLERIEEHRASIKEWNEKRTSLPRRQWDTLKQGAKITQGILVRKWRAIQAIIQDREEAGWYGHLRQQARLDVIAEERRWKARQEEIRRERLEERRLRRYENSRRRRRGLKTVLQEENEESVRLIREAVAAREAAEEEEEDIF